MLNNEVKTSLQNIAKPVVNKLLIAVACLCSSCSTVKQNAYPEKTPNLESTDQSLDLLFIEEMYKKENFDFDKMKTLVTDYVKVTIDHNDNIELFGKNSKEVKKSSKELNSLSKKLLKITEELSLPAKIEILNLIEEILIESLRKDEKEKKSEVYLAYLK